MELTMGGRSAGPEPLDPHHHQRSQRAKAAPAGRQGRPQLNIFRPRLQCFPLLLSHLPTSPYLSPIAHDAWFSLFRWWSILPSRLTRLGGAAVAMESAMWWAKAARASARGRIRISRCCQSFDSGPVTESLSDNAPPFNRRRNRATHRADSSSRANCLLEPPRTTGPPPGAKTP